MNAAARDLVQQQSFANIGLALRLQRSTLVVATLLLLVLLSAVSVIYLKDLNRQLISELQGLQHSEHMLQVDKGRLLLEQGALTTQTRVQNIAQTQMEMIAPPADVVTMVTL